ncbi:MAG: acetylglutamate kinase [Ferruginibacter sp.]
MKDKYSGENDRLNMHYGASPKLFDLAEELRARMTPVEEILWNVIKINEWHLKFRRQHPIANYIADFYCHHVKLVIELDGGYHENKEVKIYDEGRENDIKEFGITVLRFKNEEVFNNIESVIEKIGSVIYELKLVKEKVYSLNNSPLGDGGKLFVIKIGGNIVDDVAALESFLKKFTAIEAKKILIHGGGKIATSIGKQLGIEANYINGRRITDEATIDLVTMVYGGLINKKLVAALQSMNCNAIGLTGADANIIPATKRPVDEIDYGFVGDIASSALAVHSLQLFLDNKLVPVVAPLTHDEHGQLLNTNADTIASALAVALSKQYDIRLIYCFEKKGVLENMEDETSVITLIDKAKYQQLLHDKKLADGILPKIENAFAAINSGVQEVLIGHADDLLQNITADTSGTLIKL